MRSQIDEYSSHFSDRLQLLSNSSSISGSQERVEFAAAMLSMRRTIRITDPAPLAQNMKPRCCGEASVHLFLLAKIVLDPEKGLPKLRASH